MLVQRRVSEGVESITCNLWMLLWASIWANSVSIVSHSSCWMSQKLGVLAVNNMPLLFIMKSGRSGWMAFRHWMIIMDSNVGFIDSLVRRAVP